jgi:hypothetical protein
MGRKASARASSHALIPTALLAIAALSACGANGGGVSTLSGPIDHPGAGTIDTPATPTVGAPAAGASPGTGRDVAAGNPTATPASNSGSDVDDGGAPDAASNVIIVGDASGILSCDDGAAQCGCANVGITFPLAPGALDAVATDDGGRNCAALCPAMGDPWPICVPTEGGAYVRCKPECL